VKNGFLKGIVTGFGIKELRNEFDLRFVMFGSCGICGILILLSLLVVILGEDVNLQAKFD
jgi:hypothetical protein